MLAPWYPKALPFKPGQLRYAQNYYEAAGILAAMKAGVSAASIARPMQPLHIERVAVHEAEEVIETNGHKNGHTSGHSNGNGKGRRSKATNGNGAAVAVEPQTLPELLVEVGGE